MNVPWGAHICVFYKSKEDLIDILVPYFKMGLESNEFCMWVTSEPLGVKDAENALRKAMDNLDDYIKKNQLEILDYCDWYTMSGEFKSAEVLHGWMTKKRQALKRGFDGMRLTGNTTWLQNKDWKKFIDYEAKVNKVIGKHKMVAICTYPIDNIVLSGILIAGLRHQYVLIRREGKWNIVGATAYERIKSDSIR